ncbi:MAG: gallidermin family lantibiotic [Oscillospiraceae bacterium]|nr:gallidermin family lantibiotic [Oscillospiraceae bacterium]
MLKEISLNPSANGIEDLSLDIEFVKSNKDPVNQLITSKSLCTPGCGKTGTGNSFCC